MDYHGLKYGKGRPAVLLRHRKRKLAEQALEEAYAEVDKRDGSICWVTGRYVWSGHLDAGWRREHHHLKGRRVEPTWRAKPERIITVCAAAHQLITAGFLVVEGCDARKPIRFHWRDDVTERPFQIRSRRLSQQESE